MSHTASPEDQRFRSQFESFEFAPGVFDHREHVRLAYVYLCDHDPSTAHLKVREALRGYLAHHGVDPSKYHETITRAWILAVRHFMGNSSDAASFAQFIDANPQLLDSQIMLGHYSKDVLFSDEARGTFVEPNVEPIPRYDGDAT